MGVITISERRKEIKYKEGFPKKEYLVSTGSAGASAGLAYILASAHADKYTKAGEGPWDLGGTLFNILVGWNGRYMESNVLIGPDADGGYTGRTIIGIVGVDYYNTTIAPPAETAVQHLTWPLVASGMQAIGDVILYLWNRDPRLKRTHRNAAIGNGIIAVGSGAAGLYFEIELRDTISTVYGTYPTEEAAKEAITKMVESELIPLFNNMSKIGLSLLGAYALFNILGRYILFKKAEPEFMKIAKRIKI